FIDSERHNSSYDDELQLCVNSGSLDYADIEMDGDVDAQQVNHSINTEKKHFTMNHDADYASEDDDNDQEDQQLRSRAILDKLDDPLFSCVQATHEELSDFAILNIERNNDLDRMVENLRIFMGDTAHAFCRWLLSYVGPELHNLSNDAELQLSVNSGLFNDQDIDMADNQHYRHVNRSWTSHNTTDYHKDFVSDDEDNDRDVRHYGGDTRGAEDDIRTNNIRTRLTRFQATLTNHTLEYNSPEAQKRKSDAIENEHNSIRKKKIRKQIEKMRDGRSKNSVFGMINGDFGKSFNFSDDVTDQETNNVVRFILVRTSTIEFTIKTASIFQDGKKCNFNQARRFRF
ncbi:hypothetical protein GJ496_011367, partial [Pomphorhynchus laevis]